VQWCGYLLELPRDMTPYILVLHVLHCLNIVEWNVVGVDWQRYIHVLVVLLLLRLLLRRRHRTTRMLLVLQVSLRWLLIIYHRRTAQTIINTPQDYLHILVGILPRCAPRVLCAGHECLAAHRAALRLLETHGRWGLERHLVCPGDARTDRQE